MLRISDLSGGVKPLKKERTDMAKNILILSASLRAGSNSETLVNAFADGAPSPGTPHSRPPAPWARPSHKTSAGGMQS